MIILLSWIRVVIPNLAQKHGCPIFFLFSNFLAPLRDLTNTVRDVYFFVRGRIIFGDVFLSISNIAQFHFCRKKHTYTVSGVYFLFRVRIIFGDVFLVIPNIAQFSFLRKKTYSYCNDVFFLLKGG